MVEVSTVSQFDEGEEVYLGFGHRLIFYPLTWGVRKRLRKEFGVVFSGNPAVTEEWQDAVTKILHASAVRGNPQLTLEEVEEMLDMRNLKECMRALGVASSLKATISEGSDAQKEASDEPRPTVSPTGPSSTQPSSAPPAGPSSSAIN